MDKLSPENAKGQDARIKKAILSLDTFPQSHQERNEGRYAGKGYRQLIIDNYMAIFRIDEPRKIVYVVTIQYQGGIYKESTKILRRISRVFSIIVSMQAYFDKIVKGLAKTET